jgi:DNA-binding response OmpR family regulator
MDQRGPIDQILIVDSDPVHAAELEDALHTVNCRVLVCSEQEAALNTIRAEHVDLLIVVPSSPELWRKDAESLCDAVRQFEERPQIVCILRGPYRGPAERLYGDRLSIKVLYER